MAMVERYKTSACKSMVERFQQSQKSPCKGKRPNLFSSSYASSTHQSELFSSHQSETTHHQSEPNPSSQSRLNRALTRAIKLYHEHAELGLDGHGPFLVATNLSFLSYEAWSASIEGCWKLGFVLDNRIKHRGSVYLFGDPSKVHEGVAQWINAKFVHQAAQRGIEFSSLVEIMASARYNTIDGSKEPDLSYFSSSVDEPIPRVCLEVAYKNESLGELERELMVWKRSGVLFPMGIKILVKQAAGVLTFSFTWVNIDLDNKWVVINFSPETCNETNRADFLVKLPFCLFSQDVEPADDFMIEIDLFSLQNYIWKLLLKEMEANHRYVWENEVLEDNKYCLCKGPFDTTMVACDHPKCPTEWYHLACVGLSEDDVDNLPAEWWCPDCRSKFDKQC